MTTVDRITRPAGPNEIDFVRFLDTITERVEGADVFDAINTLYVGLWGYRRSLSTDEWRQYCRVAREHRLANLVMQSPMTRRAFEKPRGYAGDAIMLDLLYGYGQTPSDLTTIGAEVFRWERQASAGRSVRARRDFIATTIDFVASSVSDARVVSIACGHLREALASDAVKNGRLNEIVALDQDAESLSVIENYRLNPIRLVHGSVRDVLKGSIHFEDVDLIYAAGLYDYLSDSLGTALTARLFAMLKGGGRCLIANFAPDMLDIAYMDSFMDWHLIYRDESQLAALTRNIPDAQILSKREFRDPHGNITYCEVVKR